MWYSNLGKHLSLDISTSIDTLVPSIYQCVETCGIEVIWVLSQQLKVRETVACPKIRRLQVRWVWLMKSLPLRTTRYSSTRIKLGWVVSSSHTMRKGAAWMIAEDCRWAMASNRSRQRFWGDWRKHQFNRDSSKFKYTNTDLVICHWVGMDGIYCILSHGFVLFMCVEYTYVLTAYGTRGYWSEFLCVS